MPGAGKGIRGASLAHALLFLPSLLHPPRLPAEREGRASSIREGASRGTEGALPCVLPGNTKPTLRGVGLGSLRD